MTKTDVEVPVLNEREWALIAQLLDAEHKELLAEIRHTDRRIFRETLKERLDLIESLREKIPTQAEPY